MTVDMVYYSIGKTLKAFPIYFNHGFVICIVNKSTISYRPMTIYKYIYVS